VSRRRRRAARRRSSRARAREGERGDLVVNTRELHFFDLETGDGIYA